MKEITGGDPLQGRALYKGTITFVPQFKLVVCTNNLPEIRSNDEGTWRRIRVCDFVSKFVEEFEANVPNQFKQNKDITEKFKEWKGVFLSLLIDKTLETMGNVKDCPPVLFAAKSYRKSQDYLSEFFDDKVVKEIGSCFGKKDSYEVFKIWWSENKSGKVPSGKELFDYLDNKIGSHRNNKNKWINYKLSEDEDIESEEEND
jgi:phage/plasmid-associated DNA primase